ncbi:leucine carboxyl methyltransferase 1-like isoform X2 [Halichondria panicea]|uniref:leucine carboxyl methyltransferase 1-like isoform X2 n=1 Tax=Halichondria panicea TaxID=6063 RepID=UPI00312B75AD
MAQSRSSRRASDDLAVQTTNDDATSCKRYATQKGYWEDDFVKYFCRTSDRKSPEINRGYFARVRLYQLLVEKFLSLAGEESQVINFGAGYDTLYWTLSARSLRPKLLVEVDFEAVTARKCYYISKEPLREVLVDPVIEKDSISSKHYKLLSGDLRDMATVGEKLLSSGVDTSLPTLFLTECVLVYMDPDKSREVIRWAGNNFSTALFLNYEPIFPDDSFGLTMQANLAHRGCSLLGINACPDLESQKQRFLGNGWQCTWALDMAEVYQQLPKNEIQRIERLEFLDEKELLIQLLQHYCASCGYTDKKRIGLDKVRLSKNS